MNRPLIPALLILATVFSACGTAKHGIAHGRYSMDRQDVVVEVIDDTILIAPPPGAGTMGMIQRLPPVQNGDGPSVQLVQHSFDLDLLTIPVKYRPAAADLQPQLETQISVALYLGRRTDQYSYTYVGEPFARKERTERHVGFSYGLVAGLGGANITPGNTSGKIPADYVGVAGSLGIAFIGAWNNASLGVVVGRDHLLNSDAGHWVFEQQPWFGLAFGLNLN